MESTLFQKIRTSSCDDFFAWGSVDVSAVGEGRQSLIQEAIAFGKPDTAARLVELGAPLDQQDRKGETALHYCAFFRQFALGELLLAKGADPNLPDAFGNGPVWTAAMQAKRDFRFVEALVRTGADPSRKNKAGRSALDFARQSNNSELWRALGADQNEFKSP